MYIKLPGRDSFVLRTQCGLFPQELVLQMLILSQDKTDLIGRIISGGM